MTTRSEAPPHPLIALAKVGRPYGLTGAVHLYPYSVDAQTLLKAQTLVIGTASFAVTRSRRHGESIVAQLVGIDSPEAAARLTNKEVLVERTALAPLPDGEYYWVDLIGLDVLNRQDEALGVVRELLSTGAQTVLVMEYQQEDKTCERMIPFVSAYVDDVDLKARRIRVDWQLDY